MKLRSMHRVFGLASAPLMIITATCGTLLLYRNTGIFGDDGEAGETIVRLHNYEILAPYVGTVATVLMLATAITGLVLFCQTWLRKRKASAAQQ